MPAQNRKLIYHVAVTLDGFIADADGQFPLGALEGDHVTDYLATLKEHYDCVLMGRRTYEVGLAFGVTDPYPYLDSYVFSRSLGKSPNERVKVIAEGGVDLVRSLKASPGKDIYLCGGAELASHLLEAKLVDEIWLKLNPLLFGRGLSLAPLLGGPRALQLIESKRYASGVMLLKYTLD
jgi:dihydrofolate reductase